MDNVVLSICIPTYNRRDAVYECVINILDNYDRDDIEVIVSDNCSVDGTEEKLRTIHDKRFKYYKNNENTKYINFLIALSYASGKFSLLISDEDDIKTELLPELLKYLNVRPKYALIKSDVYMITHKVKHYKRDVSSYYNKIKACLAWACVSGVIYNNRFILPILEKMDFSDCKRYQKTIGEFPHIWLGLMICHRGGIAFYPKVLVAQARVAKSDYYLTKKAKKEYTWSLDRVFDTNATIYKSFENLQLSKLSSKEKVGLYCDRTWLLIVQASSDYLKLMYGGELEAYLKKNCPWDTEAFYKCKKRPYHHMKNIYLAYKTTYRFLVTSLWNDKRDFANDCIKNCSLLFRLYYDTLKEYQRNEKYLKTIRVDK